MKNFFKYLGLASILAISLFYTDKMSNLVINNSNLMLEINENSDDYNITPVSAIIEDDYIIPGLNGYAVNVLKSYNNMKFLNTFNSYYLQYDVLKPSVSLYNNKNKLIKYGNEEKNAVAIILENNIELINYSKEKNINISRLVNYDSFDKLSKYEQINNEDEKFNSVESMLNNQNNNTNICVINEKIKDICMQKKKFLVEPSTILNSSNLAHIKENIRSGYIIYVNDNVNLSDYKILLRQIYYQDLNVVFLSKLIGEERD